MFVTVVTAVVALPLLLYIPGWLLSRAVLPCADALETIFERVVISALLSGWLALLLASFGVFSLWLHLLVLLLVCGALLPFARRAPPAVPRLSSRLELAGFVLVLLVALLLALQPSEAILGARDAGVYANTGAAIARTGGLVQYDPLLTEIGQQAQSSDEEARARAEQALNHFFGVQHPERFIATKLYTAGFFIHEGDAPAGRIVPQHLHMASAWIGLLTSVLGLHLGLAAPGLLAVLGAWSVGMLGRRLAGAWVGVLALLLLSLNSVQVWFARYPTSETTAQFLIFAGLYFFAKFQHLNTQQPAEDERHAPHAALVYAALAGVAIGQLALTRIEFFLTGPVLLYLLYRLLARRWDRAHTALTLGLGLMFVHAALHITFIARAYFFDTAYARLQDYALTAYLAFPFITPLLREVYQTRTGSPLKDPLQIWRELAVVAAGLAALLALWRWPQPLHLAERWLWHWRRLFGAAMAALIVLLAGYAYFVRPQILTPALVAEAPECLLPPQWRVAAVPPAAAMPSVQATAPLSATDTVSPTGTISATAVLSAPAAPAAASAQPVENPCLTLQGYVGAPIELPPPPPGLDEKYMIPLANFVRVGWYMSPLGIVLGVLGFAWWWLRGVNRASWMFLVVGLLGTAFFVRDTYGTSDQSYIYILRRFVPIAYPTLSLAAAFGLVALARWRPGPPPWRWLPRAVSGALVVLLVAFFVWTGRPIYAHSEYAGAIDGLEEVAAQFEQDDVLLLRGGAPTVGQARDVPDLVASPLRFSFGLNALVVKSSNPAAYADSLAAQVRFWQQEERDVYLLLSASGGNFALPGFALEPVSSFDLRLPEFEQLTDQKPHNVSTLNLSFAVYRVRPASPEHIATLELPLNASDFAAQVRGFYLPEQPADDEHGAPYAWTNGDALLRIPWRAGDQPDILELELAGGNRPAHLGPARVCLSLMAEPTPWPAVSEDFVPLDCFTLTSEPQTYRLDLAAAEVPAAASGSALLRLQSEAWVPAAEDPARHDERPVGVQFVGVR